MDDVLNILVAAGVLTLIAILAAILLAVAKSKLSVDDSSKEHVDKIEFYLPSYNCGACGHVNCRQVAKEMVNGNIKEVSICKVISKENAKLIVDYCKANNIDVK